MRLGVYFLVRPDSSKRAELSKIGAPTPSSCVDTGWRRNQCRRIDTGTDKRRGFTGVEFNAGCDKWWSRGRQRSDARGSRRRCTGAGRWASLLASLGRRRRLALQNTRAHRGRYCSIDLLGCGLDHAQRGRRRRCDIDPCPRWVAMRRISWCRTSCSRSSGAIAHQV